MLIDLSLVKQSHKKVKIIFCDTLSPTTKYWLEIWQNNKKIHYKSLTKKQYKDREHRIKYRGLKRFYYDNITGYAY